MMGAEATFLREIEDAASSASASRRGEMVRRITDLFLGRSDELTADDLSLFDDVIVRLAAKIETHARALLARRLAPVRNAPPQVIRMLAYDYAIEVAGPVLSQSPGLDDKILVEIANTRGREHMLAISHRASLSEAVTDALIELGDRGVLLNVLDNYGASFSDRGFSVLVSRSESDDIIAEFVGLRPEIPSGLLTALVAKASQRVRARLEASHPRAKAEVRRAVAEAAGRVEAQWLSASVDYTAAQASIESLRRAGQLNEGAVAAFAKNGAYAETIAALAAMCDLPLQFVGQAMARDRSEALMVIAKAVGASWSTAREILILRARRGIIPSGEVLQRLARFERLQTGTAQEIVRVYRDRARSKAAPAT
jgi:uncharacterized protein (DUF2336 family)